MFTDLALFAISGIKCFIIWHCLSGHSCTNFAKMLFCCWQSLPSSTLQTSSNTAVHVLLFEVVFRSVSWLQPLDGPNVTLWSFSMRGETSLWGQLLNLSFTYWWRQLPRASVRNTVLHADLYWYIFQDKGTVETHSEFLPEVFNFTWVRRLITD